jgi:hypothetical protein
LGVIAPGERLAALPAGYSLWRKFLSAFLMRARRIFPTALYIHVPAAYIAGLFIPATFLVIRRWIGPFFMKFHCSPAILTGLLVPFRCFYLAALFVNPWRIIISKRKERRGGE